MDEISIDDAIQDIFWIDDAIYLIGTYCIWQYNPQTIETKPIYTVSEEFATRKITKVIHQKPHTLYIVQQMDFIETDNPQHSELVEFNVQTYSAESHITCNLWEEITIFNGGNRLLVVIRVGAFTTLLTIKDSEIVAKVVHKRRVTLGQWNKAIRRWILIDHIGEGHIEAWSTYTGEIYDLRIIGRKGLEYDCFRISPNGRYCIYSERGRTYIWNFIERKISQRIAYLSPQYAIIEWLPNDLIFELRLLFSDELKSPPVSTNEIMLRISLWHYKTDQYVKQQILLPYLPLFQDGALWNTRISCLAQWVVVPQKAYIVVFNLEKYEFAGTLPYDMDNDAKIENLKWKDDDTQLAGIGTSGEVRIWDTADTDPKNWRMILTYHGNKK